MALVGVLKILMGADTSGLDKGAKSAVTSLSKIDKAAKGLAKSGFADVKGGLAKLGGAAFNRLAAHAEGVAGRLAGPFANAYATIGEKAIEAAQKVRARMNQIKESAGPVGKAFLKAADGVGQLSRGLGKLGGGAALSGLRALAGGIRSIGGMLRGVISSVVSLPGLIAGGGLVLAIGGIVNAASDLNEQISATEATFKGASAVVLNEAKRQASAFGIVKSEYLGAANGLGAIFKASGFAEDAAAQMSVQFTNLAADLSSFRNLEFDEALEKIRAGLVGESEPLRTVGVLLSDATVKQEAYRSGLAKVGDELTEAQKVTARAAIITRQLADANGDLARTFNGPANQIRAIKGRFINLAADFGRAVQPVTQFLLGGLGRTLAKLADFVNLNEDAINNWAQNAVANGGVINNAVKGIGKFFGAAIDTAIRFAQAVVNGFNIILQGATALPIVGDMVKGAADGFDRFAQDVGNIGLPGDKIASFFDSIATGAADSAVAFEMAKTETKAFSDEILKTAADLDEFNKKLQDEIKYYGLSAEAAELFKLQAKGASQAQLEEAAASLMQKEALDRAKEQRENFADRFRSAMEARADNPLPTIALKGSAEAREAVLKARLGVTQGDPAKGTERNTREAVDWLKLVQQGVENLPQSIAAAQAASQAPIF